MEGRDGRADDGLARLMVLLPITISDAKGARLIVDPATDIARPPGSSVCPETTNCSAELATITEEPNVIDG